MKTPDKLEAADVLVKIGAKHNVAKFMVMDVLDRVTKIQELTRGTIALYAKNSRKTMYRSNFVSTRFILDLERATFKMTHITHCVSHAIIIADIERTWCRSMNDQMDLEKGWKNKPLTELYPTQSHITNSTKRMEMLQNVLRMIRNSNGVPLAAVICKRLIPLPDTEDIAFGLQHSKYVSHDEEMIERAPILDRKTYDQNATDIALVKIGPFYPRYLAARSLV